MAAINRNVHLIEHSLMAAKMARLRDKTTGAIQFRETLEQIAILLLGLSRERMANDTAPGEGKA